MNRCLLFIMVTALCAVSSLAQVRDSTWDTPFELSGGIATPRYAETLRYCRRLAAYSPWVHVVSFGESPQRRQLPLVIVSRDNATSPQAERRSGKAIVLIQSGIHAGEIDGKDASLMLIRDIVIKGLHRKLLDHAVILFIPIFNVDGHERFGPLNRINQNGPVSAGWRVTAQNLNLNRDYMKADAPEMRAMLQLFSEWLPDLVVDCHVTDGIDCQYDVTYAVEPEPNLDQAISRWVNATLIPTALHEVQAAHHLVFPYVFPREDYDLSKGFILGAATPRFSTGYAAVQNRPAVLIETHMLKPYKTRVDATYAFLVGILSAVNASSGELRQIVRHADQMMIAACSAKQRPMMPIRFGTGADSVVREFRGIEAIRESSSVSGGMRTLYTGKTVSVQAPVFDHVVVTDSVSVPLAYAIPPEWTAVVEVLRAHAVRMRRLRKPVSIRGESYRFTEVHFAEKPYEGRQTATYAVTLCPEQKVLPAGTWIVPTSQRTGRVIVNLLEPRAPDALVGWGMFNAIFEQKEYAEAYVMEAVADTMLKREGTLRKEFEEKLLADSVFARSPAARLNWLYLHSAWGDPSLNLYPVMRVMDPSAMEAVRRNSQ